MKKFVESKNPFLKNLSEETMNYIKNKNITIIDPAYIDKQSRLAIKNHPDSLCKGVANMSNIMRPTKIKLL